MAHYFHCRCLFHHLREQRHSIGDTPGQGIRRAQGRSHPEEKDWEVRFLTDACGPFERGRALARFPWRRDSRPIP
jgi:hypothetical protein